MRCAKLLTVYLAAEVCMFAGSITFQGPFGATDGSVSGPNLYFDIQDATLTQPSASGGDWTLTIHTNYGALLPGPAGNVIPDFRNLAAADFLISWDGDSFGIVLHSHDGYTAGDLYEASGFQTTGQVLNAPTDPQDPGDDVWLDAGGSQIGAGTVSAASYGDGVTEASYTITDIFQAPANFLSSGDFEIQMSSADCANGYMTGTGSFGGDSTGAAPEPGTLLLFASGLLLVYRHSKNARTPAAHFSREINACRS
jgi:hypothetical protein